MAPSATNTEWTVGFDVLRREKLFRNPPKDRTAYPSLEEAIRPHVDSFNALFGESKIIEHALHDIGTKTFLDGDNETPEQRRIRKAEGRLPPQRNRLNVRIRDVFLEKAMLPQTNKFSVRNREIFPSECRERHVTYRGRLRVRLEWQVNNGEWKESIRELGQAPLMLRVCPLQPCVKW